MNNLLNLLFILGPSSLHLDCWYLSSRLHETTFLFLLYTPKPYLMIFHFIVLGVFEVHMR